MKEKKGTRTKSYTSVYDVYNPRSHENSANRKSVENYLSQLINIPLMTRERYQVPNKDNEDENRVHSTSTFFYDLDTIAKRKSFNCISEVTLPKHEVFNTKTIRNGGKSKAKNLKGYPIRMYSNQSIAYNNDVYSTEIKKLFPRDSDASSNFNIRCMKNSNTYLMRNKNKKEKNPKDQKMWKYSKYQVGNCSAFVENRKRKYKDLTYASKKNHLHDYSYCNKKSATKFNENTKSLKTKNQLSSTMLIPKENNKNAKVKTMQNKSNDSPLDNSYTLTEFDDSITDESFNSKYLTKNITRRIRKHRHITCPNCNEKVLVTTVKEDRDSDTKKVGKRHNSIEFNKTLNYRYVPCNVNYENVTKACCSHEPQCDLIPVCQMLPPNQSFERSRGVKYEGFKSPRMLRVIKACRHHPPCTMVPSCQRVQVLKNNCQYITECPHRPRCVNLPLCAPFSKTININQFSTKNTEDIESANCQITRCNYVPQVNEHSMGINMIYHNQLNKTEKTIDYFNPCSPTFFMNPKINPKSFSPYQISTPTTYTSCKLNQSCQYDSFILENNKPKLPESAKSEGVIFIRDVGCQFRNKYNEETKTSYESRDSKTSSAGIDIEDSSQITNESLRSEDKIKNRRPEAEVESTDLSSINESSHCTSSEHKIESNHRNDRSSGFVPTTNTSQFVAFSTHTEPMLSAYLSRDMRDQVVPFSETCSNTSPTRVMSRRSFLKQKYKKMFCVRRRRKSRVSNQSAYCCLRRVANHQTIK